MGWKLINGRPYYYPSVRDGSRVRTEYVGGGELAGRVRPVNPFLRPMLRSGHGRKGVNHVTSGAASGARTVLARWRRSGLSVRAFCRAEGVSEPSFYGWRRKLDQADHKKPAFLPVKVVSEETKEPATRGIEIVLANGRCLRVGPGFDPQTLVKLVDLFEAGGISC
jgi:transposase